MTTQTEAELCAQALELDRDMVRRNKRSAAELRRLVSFNQQLMDEVARLQKREWVGLTPEEVKATVYDANGCVLLYEDRARAIEAILKEKNGL